MILMPSQGRTTSKGFLTVCIRALVRSFSRMDPTMSCERAGITERLQNVSNCGMKLMAITIYLATPLTHVRFLASVYSHVNR